MAQDFDRFFNLVAEQATGECFIISKLYSESDDAPDISLVIRSYSQLQQLAEIAYIYGNYAGYSILRKSEPNTKLPGWFTQIESDLSPTLANQKMKEGVSYYSLKENELLQLSLYSYPLVRVYRSKKRNPLETLIGVSAYEVIMLMFAGTLSARFFLNSYGEYLKKRAIENLINKISERIGKGDPGIIQAVQPAVTAALYSSLKSDPDLRMEVQAKGAALRIGEYSQGNSQEKSGEPKNPES